MTFGIIEALGFMLIGGAVVEYFDHKAWKRYQQGKNEGNPANYYNQRR